MTDAALQFLSDLLHRRGIEVVLRKQRERVDILLACPGVTLWGDLNPLWRCCE